MRSVRIVQITLVVLAVLLVGYLAVLAVAPSENILGGGFGEPAHEPTIAIVTAVLGGLCVLSYLARSNRASASVPVAIVVGLLATGFVLAFSSYWRCSDKDHPTFFTPLVWTASFVKGGVDDRACPETPPVALEVARLAILAAIFVSVVGVATAAFRVQSDRLRAGWARSVTAVVDVDDVAASMMTAIARTAEHKTTLVLMTTNPDSTWAQEARTSGARVIAVDFNRPETFGAQRLWRRLNRLYLLSPDPSTNLLRLGVITQRLAAAGVERRIPLIVRIDDPWLAEAWRAEQFGGSDTRWAGDAVGKFGVTARRLLDQIVGTATVRRIIVAGSSQLTLAICTDMARRKTERDYYIAEGEPDLPALTLVAANADEYQRDVEFYQQRRGFGTSRLAVDVVLEQPSEPVLSRLVGDAEATTAAILVDSVTDPTTGTRLAARYPGMPLYVWDPQAHAAGPPVPIVNNLCTYPLGMDLPEGQAHDDWERAAMLIHERYAAEPPRDSPAKLPWAQLDEFYRDSNRRQVRNTLWMVERIAGHTWNTWGMPQDQLSPASLRDMTPIEQLRRLGFTDDAARAMARAEFEDWSRYYRKAGWRHGPKRDYERKINEKLVDSWADVAADPELSEAAMRSLATTLTQLRELGYRSQPMWQPYRRVGTVTARRRWLPWTWTSPSGQTMRAAGGHWEVRDDGNVWSVRNDIFRSTYERLNGNRWNARGIVLARPARPGETVDTLEGPQRAAEGDWVVQGRADEQWPVPRDKFAQRYEGPVSLSDRYDELKL